MTIIIFIIILGVLVLVHECGHFLAAKKAGVRIDEFGFGYPPRLLTLGKRWGTVFSLNWIPFGGFVKILGENYIVDDKDKNLSKDSLSDPKDAEENGVMFTQVSKLWQVVILTGGVFFNFVFACLLFGIAFMAGMPTATENDLGVAPEDPRLTIISVVKGGPADIVGLKGGDVILSLSDNRVIEDDLDPKSVSDFISSAKNSVMIGVDRGGQGLFLEVTPETGLVAGRKAIGISMDSVGIVKLPFFSSMIEGVKMGSRLTYFTVVGLFDFFISMFKSETDFSSITGPVGIVGLVGDASRLGVIHLLTFTALISINLAVINLIPFPALDGGRILFVFIEALKGSPMNPRFASITNMISFALLVTLMVVVTVKDIINLF